MSLINAKHKAAGHDGPVQTEDGSLFCKPTNKQEMDFYAKAAQLSSDGDDSLPLGSLLTDWMPIHYGSLTADMQKYTKPKDTGIDKFETNSDVDTRLKKDSTYIVLQDVLYGFKRPNVLDIKLGSILFDESASKEKVERMKKVSKSTTSGSLAFRICGMQMANDFPGTLPADISGIDMKGVCDIQEDGYLGFNKFFGRRLTSKTVVEGLRIFFRYNKLDRDTQDQMIKTFTMRLMMFYNCILDSEIRAVSSSLLFVYENDQQVWKLKNYEDPLIKESEVGGDGDVDAGGNFDSNVDGNDDNENYNDNANAEQRAPLSELKYIDFAHSKFTPGMGYD